MTPDDFKDAWKRQPSRIRLTIDAKQLDAEVRDFQKRFTATLFWRDLREVGLALVLLPLWLFLGRVLALPWSWYFVMPVLVWIAGYMLLDRLRNKRRPSEPAETLRGRLESALAQVEQQIHLLKSVFWWALLPLAAAMLAFIGQIAWLTGSADGWTALFVTLMILIIGIIFFVVYALNQHAVRTDLLPRREQLRTQLLSLQDESAESEAQE